MIIHYDHLPRTERRYRFADDRLFIARWNDDANRFAADDLLWLRPCFDLPETAAGSEEINPGRQRRSRSQFKDHRVITTLPIKSPAAWQRYASWVLSNANTLSTTGLI